jgi:nitroreductase
VSPTASYDAGAAAMALLLQAHALGLAAHAMSGLDGAALRASFEIPERYAVLSMISVAHHGNASSLPEGLAERESAPRTRQAIDEIARFGRWSER